MGGGALLDLDQQPFNDLHEVARTIFDGKPGFLKVGGRTFVEQLVFVSLWKCGQHQDGNGSSCRTFAQRPQYLGP